MPAYISMDRGGFLETGHVGKDRWVFHYEGQELCLLFCIGLLWKRKQAQSELPQRREVGAESRSLRELELVNIRNS